MNKTIKISFLIASILFLSGCASRYSKINPETLNYVSKSFENRILLEYKYDLLEKKYKKKETEADIKLVAVKITNNTKNDIVFGNDFTLAYENGSDVVVADTDKLFKCIKQSPASYLWYLLLSPLQFTTSSTTSNSNSRTSQNTNSFPVGLIIGPGLAGANMIASSNANKNFKKELMQYDLNNKKIKTGETIYGLVGIYSLNYDSITTKLK